MPPTVVSFSPADGAVDLAVDCLVSVRLQRTDSNDVTMVETSQADFETGTLTDVVANPEGTLTLREEALAQPDSLSGLVLWLKADTIAGLSDGDAVSSWLDSSPFGNDASQGNGTNKPTYKTNQVNGKPAVRFTTDDFLSIADDNSLDITSSMTCFAVVSFDSYSAARQETILFKGTGVINGLNYSLGKYSGGDLKFTYIDGVGWRDVRYTNGTAAGWHAYFWQPRKDVNKVQFYRDGGNGSLVTDPYNLGYSANANTARVGLNSSNAEPLEGYLAEIILFNRAVSDAERRSVELYLRDKYGLTSIPTATNPTTGNRVSPAYSLSAVGKAASTRVEWDADVPSGGSLTVEARIDGGTWNACTNGGAIPGISDGDDLSGATIEVREALSRTSGTDPSPVLSEVRLLFMPQDPSLVEIVVNGRSNTVANGGLTYWGDQKISGGVLVTTHQDLTYLAGKSWGDGSGKDVTVEVKVDGTSIDSATFTTVPFESYEARGFMLWSAWTTSPAWRYGDGAIAFHVVDYAADLVTAEIRWQVVESVISSANMAFWVAHPFWTDTPTSHVAGEPVAFDTPSSHVVNGWMRADTPHSLVAQGWLRQDQSVSSVAGNRFASDRPSSEIVGRRIESDTPSSHVVYQVNARNVVDLQIISVEMAEFLAALGVSFD